MKNSFLILYLLYFLLSYYKSSAQNKKAPKPNIIFFLVDDMGWQDTSVPFWDSITPQNKKFETPNMVQFATTAVKFTNAYANSICTPSRVSLMTGMNATRHRVTNWTAFKNQKVDAKDSLLSVPDWDVNGLSPIQQEKSVVATPLTQVFKDNGYQTIMCGKAHFGAVGTIGANPLNLGFIKNIGGSAAGNPASYYAKDSFGHRSNKYILTADIPNMKNYWGGNTFLTEDLTKEAIKQMDTARMLQKPFFLYLAHYAVHLPYNADDRFVQKYLNKGYSKAEAAYCALVEGMDKSFGEILTYLKENKLDQNTIVVFMSDNGGYSHAPRQGNSNTQNYPLRGGKGSLYEGGIREPMMIRWPGVSQPNTICRQYVTIQDFYPTLLQMAGIRKVNTMQKIDGVSIVPFLKHTNKINNKRSIVWNFPNKWVSADWGDDNLFISAIRKGNWKLLYFEKSSKLELYNLESDIKESQNLAQKYPKRLKQLTKVLTHKLKRMHAQMPIVKMTNKAVPYPNELL